MPKFYSKVKKIDYKKAVSIFLSAILIFQFLFLPQQALAITKAWDFSTSSDYTFDNTKIEFSSGQAQLKATSTPVAWYNISWGYRRKITFDNSAQAENLTNFPVLVKLDSTKIDYSNTQDSGQDIRFTDSDGTTLLSYEIEEWNETATSSIWVKVPQIDASSNTDHIYMYYGNTAATDGQGATSVWGQNFKGVWHMKDEAGAVSETIASLTFLERIDDVFPTSTRPHMQGVASDGTYLYITQDDQIKKLNKSDYSLVASHDDPQLDGTDMTQVNSIFIYGDYLYLGANNYDNLPKQGYVKVFNKSDLSYVEEHQNVEDHTSEGASFHDNSWWIVYFDWAYVSRYDSNWNHLADYPLQRNASQGNIWIGDYLYVPKTDPNHIEIYHWDGNALDFVKLLSLPDEMDYINGIGKEPDEDILWVSELLYDTNHNNLVKTTINWTTVDLNDSTENANNSTIKSSSEVDSQISKAQSFNGSSNSATITDDDTLDFGTGSFSYQAWVKTDSSTGNQGIIDKRGSLAGDSDFRGYLLWTNSGVIKANVSGDNAGNSTVTSAGASISDGAWYHVTVVVNKATNIQYLYVNGSLVDSDSIAGITGSVSTQSNLMFGYKSTTGATSITYFNGTVDEVRLSDAVLSAEWIAASYKTENDTFNSYGAEQTLYPTDNPTIYSQTTQTFTLLSAFTETSTLNGGAIKYQISNDGGTTWYWYNSGWQATSAGYTEANTASDINTNISTFLTGSGSFLFRAYLHSDGSQLVQLDSVDIAGVPLAPTIDAPTVLSSSSIRWNFTNNSDDETGFRIYDNTDTLVTSSATVDLAYLDETDLSENTQYSGRYATAYNGFGNSASSSAASAKYTLADTPINLSASSNSNSVSLTVDSFPNDTSDSSGYYFSRSGTNSGWIQTNSWQDTGLSCGTSYTYTVKYRNGDGVETETISLTQSTSGCGGGGGMPSAWYNPPKAPEGGFKILINNDAKYTDSPIVTLNLFGGPEAARMAISNNPEFSGLGSTGQIPYQSSYSWDICKGQKECLDGTYTVYAKFYTQWGLSSEVVSDSIILDTTPEKEEITPPETKPKIPEIPPVEKPLVEPKPKLTVPTPIPEVPTPPLPPTVILIPQALAESKPDVPIFFSAQGNIILESIVPQKPLKLVTGLELNTTIKPSKPVKAIKVIIIFKGPKESSHLKDNFLSALIAPVYAQVWQVAEYILTDGDGDGIFEGKIKMPEVAGEYVIRTILYYEDGTIKDIETETLIDPKGYIYQAINGKEIRIPDAKISLYRFNLETNQFELWQAQEYGQENSQITDKTGEYNFLVPEGKYYLTITATDYGDYQSEEFETKEGNVINRNIELTLIKKFNWQWLIFPVILIVGIIIGIFIKTRKKYQ